MRKLMIYNMGKVVLFVECNIIKNYIPTLTVAA